MKVVTAEQMREIDRVSIEERGIPGLQLMEQAGRAVVDDAMNNFDPDSVLILAGKGNNAGDGFVAARLLQEAGVKCRVDLFADPDGLKGDALANYQQLPDNVETRVLANADGLAQEMEEFDLTVDALLGTGIKGAVTGLFGDVIEAMNKSRAPVLAVDIPSGLPADGADPEGPVVRATLTVTMGLPKLGMLVHPGIEFTGAITVADLGFPKDLIEDPGIKLNIHSLAEMKDMLPARPADGHKGTFGTALILAGSRGMTGASALAARAAARSGVGLVYSAMPKDLAPVFDTLLIEAVKHVIPTTAGDRFDADSTEAALELAKAANSVALGPGLSTRPGVSDFVNAFVKGYDGPLVIDADGLNALGENPECLKERSAPTIITPHPGEMSRLCGVSTKEIQSNRIAAAQEFASRHGVTVALKGAQTIIADPDGQTCINTSGNSGLAKGGSGDVLTGLIAGLLAQGMSAGDTARLGVFLHGLAGDKAAKKIGVRAMIPSDVIEVLGEAFRTIEEA